MNKLATSLSVALCAGALFGATDEIGMAVARTFAGKTAVITGAASGMGLCTSRTLAAAGATVFMCDINGDGVRKAADEINAQGKGRAYAVEADVGNLRTPSVRRRWRSKRRGRSICSSTTPVATRRGAARATSPSTSSRRRSSTGASTQT